MQKLIVAAFVTVFAFGMQIACAADAAAPSGCEAKAVSKSGKKLAGAAKTTFMKKCEADGGVAPADAAAPAASGCADKAVSKTGKKLFGAAKTAFMKKCEADAKAAK